MTLHSLFEDFYAARGLASEPTLFDGRSDYGPFIAEGVDIPAGGLFTGAEVRRSRTTSRRPAAAGGDRRRRANSTS